MDEPVRTRAARAAAERALVRVVHHYGGRPEFVLLGGLVPDLLCATSDFEHTGTTDVDVQVDLEIASGSVNVTRLERALRNAEFEPDDEQGWRWLSDTGDRPILVKFELLADLEHAPGNRVVRFDECEALAAVNLPGSGFAARDAEVRELTARVGDVLRTVELNVTGLAGFLLAKNAAARSRRLPRDWYDLAFVLLHNDAGGPEAAAHRVRERFGADLGGAPQTALKELAANFADERAQGTRAYVEQMRLDQPESRAATLAADAITAVHTFTTILLRNDGH